MSVIVRIPATLRAATNGAKEVSVEGTTIRLVFKILCQQYPGLEPRLLNQGELPRHLNAHIELDRDGDTIDVKFEQGLDTPVQDGQTIAIMAAVAGG
jgi:molybdopterin converting factor small subunit